MIWAAMYLLIGLLIAGEAKGKKTTFMYIAAMLLWPFILLVAYISLVDSRKRGRRK